MGLLDIFKRQGAAGAASAASEPVEAARARARRRLIGAVVLLGVGVVAFPLLFETQPRPIPVDIPIEIPSRDGQPPLALPPPKVAAAPATPAASALPSATKASAPSVVSSAAESRVAAGPSDAAPKETSPRAAPAVAPPAPAKPAPEPAKPAAEAPGRFVVQVGAFAEAAAVRQARAKVEKLGLASYTQVVDTSNGPRTRVRLGPFDTRDEAEKAAAKLKAAGLPGAVLTL
jgi:DedD protein